MKYKTINSDKFNTPYSDAIEIGDIVEFSGMLGNTENGLVDGGFESELHQIFHNLKDGLDYYSLNLSNITKVFSQNKVSIKRLIQNPNKSKGTSSIIIISHKSKDDYLRKIIKIISKKNYVIKSPKFIRIDDN